MNIGCILAFFGPKLIRQIFRIFNEFHFYGKSEMLASDWSKSNIGCISATVQHRKTYNSVDADIRHIMVAIGTSRKKINWSSARSTALYEGRGKVQSYISCCYI